jgi:hypothetical protein
VLLAAGRLRRPAAAGRHRPPQAAAGRHQPQVAGRRRPPSAAGRRPPQAVAARRRTPQVSVHRRTQSSNAANTVHQSRRPSSHDPFSLSTRIRWSHILDGAADLLISLSLGHFLCVLSRRLWCCGWSGRELGRAKITPGLYPRVRCTENANYCNH